MQPTTTQRDPLIQTLLATFVPFYMIYWLWVTAKELEARFGHKAPNIWFVLAPSIISLGWLLLLIPVMFGSAFADGGITFVVFMLSALPLLIVAMVLGFWYYWKFSEQAEKSLGKGVEAILLFLLFYLFAPVVVYIVQEKLNTTVTLAQHPFPQSPANPQPPAL